jgi:hypothetical protein
LRIGNGDGDYLSTGGLVNFIRGCSSRAPYYLDALEMLESKGVFGWKLKEKKDVH